MENHLIIGLGGTGGQIIRAFRKRVYQEFRTNEVPNEKMNNVCVRYLWVDSSEKDLNETQSWRTLGKSVALDPGDKVKINETTTSIFDRIEDYPGISPWIGDKKTWDHIKGGITDESGGQRRRLGRLLFAWNIGNFRNSLNTHVSRLQKDSGNFKVTFHICLGLAGGTGSGCVIDVISLIREEYPDNKIFLYAKLPETATLPPEGWVANTGYYRPNGYAALLELNALSVKAYQPFDIQGRKDTKSGKVKRMMTDRGTEAFTCAYIYSNVNDKGGFLDVANGELFEVVADFLYHKIITIKHVGNTQLQRLESSENDNVEHEDGIRSKRFLSFGMGRIEYPEQEIREYVQYNFEKQAILQFKYNSWSDNLGFTEKSEDEIGLGYGAELRNDRNGLFPKWCIDDEHLMLSKKIVEDSRHPWKPFDEDWKKVHQFKTLAKEEDKTEWMNKLEEFCSKRYDEQYRGVGVLKFFRNQKEEIKDYAKHIRGLIERDLFKDWENGNKSIIEVEKFLQTLIDINEDRIKKLGEKQQKKHQECDEIESKLVENRKKWNKRKILTNLDKLLGTHCDLLQSKYQKLTEEEGYDYAWDLLREVNNELLELRDVINSLKTTVTDLLEDIESKINSRCKTDIDSSTGKSKVTYKMYEPEEVRKKTNEKIIRNDVNKENARTVRKKLIEAINDDAPNFTKMRRIGEQELINVFENICVSSAVDAIKEEQKSAKVNILEKIAKEYGNDEEKLGRFIEDKLNLAGVLVQENAKESTAYHGDEWKTEYALLLPEYEDSSNFRKTFVKKFSSICNKKVEVAENYKSNEIIILSITSVFPLRYLANVESLKKEYDAKIADSNENQHKMLLHTEGDGSQFPSLYADKWDEGKKEEFSPYLLLALAMGIIKKGFRGEGYGNQIVYYIDDDKKTSLNHKTYCNVVKNIEEDKAENIKKMVEDKLNTGEYLSKAKHEALKAEINGNIHKAVEKECGKNKSNWEKIVDAKRSAEEILDRDKNRLTD